MYKAVPVNWNVKKDTILPPHETKINSMIISGLHYVNTIWTSCDKKNLGRVLKLQK